MRSAVLLVNLGSPDSPSVPDVRRYLREFLMDERVIDSPFPIRWAVVNLMILPSRPKESAHAYSTIWKPDGSPLITMSRRLQELVRPLVNAPVELAMRYGKPSIPDVIRKMVAGPEAVERIILVPLYPHYAMSSYETVVVAVQDAIEDLAPDVRLDVIPPFFEDPLYIYALRASAAPYLSKGFDHLLISFHGIPVRHLLKADTTGSHCQKSADCCSLPSPARETCYRAQTLRTAAAFAAASNLTQDQWSVSFQSRLGKEPWLSPYTDHVLERLPKQGVKKLLVMCPAFVADCLETLEEIDVRGRESFLAAGGESFTMIPCLNDHPIWVEALTTWIRSRLAS